MTGALSRGTLVDHRQRGLDRNDVAVERLVGARARTDIHHRFGLAQCLEDPSREAGVRPAKARIADAYVVIELHHDKTSSR